MEYLKRTAYILIVGIALVFVLDKTQFLLVPLLLAFIMTQMLLPLNGFFDHLVKNRYISIFLTMLSVTIPIAGLGFLFSYQVRAVFQNIPDISNKIIEGVNKLFEWLNSTFGLTEAESKQWLEQNIDFLMEAPMQLMQQSINSSSSLMISLALFTLGVFFFLFYHDSFRSFLLQQFAPEPRKRVQKVLHDMKHLVRQYLYGLLLVILILAVLNSLGLWIIGVGYPVFWGGFAALLAVIPYVGTFLGGALPALYALAAGEWWQPIAVLVLYSVVQMIEGNLITPKVVGGSVRINPFVALLAIMIFGSIWGVAGIVLSLPLIASVKLVFDQIDATKSTGLLMGDHLHQQKDKFLKEYDEDRFRISDLFK